MITKPLAFFQMLVFFYLNLKRWAWPVNINACDAYLLSGFILIKILIAGLHFLTQIEALLSLSHFFWKTLYAFVLSRIAICPCYQTFCFKNFQSHQFCTLKPANFPKCATFLIRNHQFGDAKNHLVFFEIWQGQIFWGPWRQKGERNKLKILLLPKIIKIFHIDANIICRQLKNVFFQVGPNEIFGWCQKFFFQLKNSHRISKKLQSVSK